LCAPFLRRDEAPSLQVLDERFICRVIARLAAGQHGLVSRRQLLECGVGKGAVNARLDRGQLHVVHRGVYAVGHRLLSAQGRWMAAVPACGPETVLSRKSAGQLWRIVPPASHRVEVTRPSACSGHGGISVHRGIIRRDERGEVLGIPVTSVARTQFDLAAVLSKRGVERAMRMDCRGHASTRRCRSEGDCSSPTASGRGSGCWWSPMGGGCTAPIGPLRMTGSGTAFSSQRGGGPCG